ncbi:outer membrane lipoprotein carrier protein LolA [Apibacter raozihei]|uniref:LolA family protein n=1 Tax=Apibacter raozihei TaxID=2500547 RepID=UPI000FE3EB7D|nr:outer membrane lipoprotein carrier protein LolA [Apibacter raozihei]
MRNHNKLIVVLLLISTCMLGQKKALTSSEIKALKINVENYSSKISSLESNFFQVKHMDFMEKDIKSSGKLYFKSGNVRWEYSSPYNYYMILKNNKMHINDNGKKKEMNMSSSEMLKELSKVISGTIQGKNIFDESKFQINYYKVLEHYQVVMVPKDKNIKKYIKQVEIGLSGNTYLVNTIKVMEPTEDYTIITFSNQKKNNTISDAKFNF